MSEIQNTANRKKRVLINPLIFEQIKRFYRVIFFYIFLYIFMYIFLQEQVEKRINGYNIIEQKCFK